VGRDVLVDVTSKVIAKTMTVVRPRANHRNSAAAQPQRVSGNLSVRPDTVNWEDARTDHGDPSSARSDMAKGFEIKFDKDWKKTIQRAAAVAVQEEVRKTQAMLDRIFNRYNGQPVSIIKPVLLREWRRDGGTMTDAEATDWAELISDGQRIVLKQG
jgi:hypothetical protein